MFQHNLNKEEQSWLLELARRAILSHLAGVPLEPKSIAGEVFSEVLQQPAGAFVTLQCRGDLRGCVGYIKPHLPLYRTVVEAAVAAAFRDFRFSPLLREDVDFLEIEISVLSELVPIEITWVEVGKHGLVVSQGSQSGLLLPQVAAERDWTPEQFVEETCVKAGLPRDACQKGADLQGFTALVFSGKGLYSE